MEYYVALIHKEPRSDFGVSFPDIPGCVSAGKTYEEAVAMAIEALGGHIATLREMGEKVPAARAVERIRKDATSRAADDWIDLEDAMIAMIPLLPVEGKSKAFNVSIPETLMSAIDRYAETRGTTRSGALAAGARLLLASDPLPAKKAGA